MKTAIIAGATGLVGKQLMFKLLENKNYDKVIILVRNLMQVKHIKLDQMVVNFDFLSVYQDQLAKADYFCCLGTTMKKAGNKEAFYKVDYTYCYEFAKIAAQNSADKFILISAIGADASSAIYYSKVKGELEASVIDLNISALHIFHPSVLTGNRLEFRFGEVIGIAVAKLLSPLMLGGLAKYKPMEASRLAEAMIKAAQMPQNVKAKKWSYKEIMSAD